MWSTFGRLKGKDYTVGLVNGANPSTDEVLNYLRGMRITFDNKSGEFAGKYAIKGDTSESAGTICLVYDDHLISMDASGVFQDGEQLLSRLQTLYFTASEAWYQSRISGQSSGASGTIISTDGVSTITVALDADSVPFEVETVDNGPDSFIAREDTLTSVDAPTSITADADGDSVLGESKVKSVQNIALGTMRVLVSDDEADEGLVDSRMGAFI